MINYSLLFTHHLSLEFSYLILCGQNIWCFGILFFFWFRLSSFLRIFGFQLFFFLLFFFFLSVSFLSAFVLLFNLLRCFIFLLFEVQIYHSCPHHTVTQDTPSSWFGSSWERRIVFVLSLHFIAITFVTLLICLVHSSCPFQNTNSKITSVAFQAPSFFRVVLYVQVAIKTPSTVVDLSIITVWFLRNFISQQQFFILFRIISHAHNCK